MRDACGVDAKFGWDQLKTLYRSEEDDAAPPSTRDAHGASEPTLFSPRRPT